MTTASGAGSYLAYIPEVTFGTTPATPTLTSVPFVSSSLDISRATLPDNSIVSNRQHPLPRVGNISGAGNIATVLRHGAYDAFLESLMLSAFATNVLKNGKTRKSMSIEVGYTDITEFRVFTGVVVNQMQLTVPTNALVTAQFDVLTVGSSALTGTSAGTIAAASFGEGLSHLNGTFKEGGSTVGIMTQLQMTVTNGYTQTYVLGNNQVHDVPYGDLTVSGTVTAYFEDASMVNKFINETVSSLDFTLLDTTGATLQFVLPSIRYTGGAAPIQNSGPITISLPFSAGYDSTAATTLAITRSA